MKDTQPAAPIRVLLASLIDYAGLFPPAALPMEQAVEKFTEYRAGEYSWALGRFVVPARRLAALPAEFPASVLVEDLSSIPDADTLEIRAGSTEEIERIANAGAGRTIYVEVANVSLLDTIGANGLRAKIRTGGVTPAAFPSAENVARFVAACMARSIAFKATAGLHHPLRCVRLLTYEPDAERGTMHGFLNVFLAAALAADREQEASTLLATMVELLNDDDPRSFTLTGDAISWRGRRITTQQIVESRNYATSFGSCSFEEPIADLKELHWL